MNGEYALKSISVPTYRLLLLNTSPVKPLSEEPALKVKGAVVYVSVPVPLNTPLIVTPPLLCIALYVGLLPSGRLQPAPTLKEKVVASTTRLNITLLHANVLYVPLNVIVPEFASNVVVPVTVKSLDTVIFVDALNVETPEIVNVVAVVEAASGNFKVLSATVIAPLIVTDEYKVKSRDTLVIDKPFTLRAVKPESDAPEVNIKVLLTVPVFVSVPVPLITPPNVAA